MTEIYGSRVILNIGIAKILGDLSRIYHREFDWSYWSKIRARHCLWLMHFWRLPMVTNRWQEWRHREEVCFITAHQWLSHQCSLIQNQHHERYVLNCPLPPYFNWVPNIPWPQLHASLQCVHQFHQWWWQMLQLKFDLINKHLETIEPGLPKPSSHSVPYFALQHQSLFIPLGRSTSALAETQFCPLKRFFYLRRLQFRQTPGTLELAFLEVSIESGLKLVRKLPRVETETKETRICFNRIMTFE